MFSAIDFLLGDGDAPSTTNVRWQTFLNGGLTGAGFYSTVTKGVTVGWADTSGFDELRVAASSGAAVASSSPEPSYLPGFGTFQGIAIDYVQGATRAATTAPLATDRHSPNPPPSRSGLGSPDSDSAGAGSQFKPD